MIYYFLPFSQLRKAAGLSELNLVKASHLSRGAVRQLSDPANGNVTMKTINQLAEFFNREVEVILSAQDTLSEYSVVATALKIERDGFESWKVHLFNFVDEFRRTMDTRLVILPPPKSGDPRIIAMLASSTRFLCDEIGTATPQWAIRRCFLSTPWFVSGMNSLKASALLESPLVYRMNNIFVHENFLLRA